MQEISEIFRKHKIFLCLWIKNDNSYLQYWRRADGKEDINVANVTKKDVEDFIKLFKLLIRVSVPVTTRDVNIGVSPLTIYDPRKIHLTNPEEVLILEYPMLKKLNMVYEVIAVCNDPRRVYESILNALTGG
jgi:hypothetical protein